MSAQHTSFLHVFLHVLIGVALLFASSLPAQTAIARSTSAVHPSTPPNTPAHTQNATPRDVVFVIDTSRAMAGTLSDVRAATKTKIDEMAAQAGVWRWSVITFRDNVSLLGTTTNAATAKNWLDVIGADGGDDCPNESFGALQLAADVAPGGDVWLFTASSPHGGEIALHQTMTKLRARNMRVYPLVTGWCYGAPFAAQQVQGTLASAAPTTLEDLGSIKAMEASGLYTLPAGVGAVALAGGQFAPQAAPTPQPQLAGATRTANSVNQSNATDFTISLAPFGAGWFYPGTAQRYTLYATGNITASNVVITLTLPNSVTYQSYSVLNGGQPGGGLTPIQTGNHMIWSIGPVQGAWEQQFNVQVAVSPSAPTGTAYATAQISASAEDTNTYNNTSALPRGGYLHEIVVPLVDAAVEKALPYQTIPTPGSEMTYSLNVFNKGNSVYSSPIVVTDVLPAHVEFITATIVDLYGGGSVPSTFAQNGQTLTWNLTNLPLRYSSSVYPPGPVYYSPVWVANVRVRVLASAPVSASLENVLQVSVPATDTNPADNVFTHTVNIVAATYDTFVTKGISNCYPYYPNNYCGYAPNSEFDYVINFANSGNSAASQVRITDTLPAALTFITTTATAGFTQVGNQLRWSFDFLNAHYNNAGYFTVRVRVKNTATPGTIFTNTIQISQAQADASSDNNQASASAIVTEPIYDLSVQKSLFNSFCFPNAYPNNVCDFPQDTLVDYSIAYANNGNTTASNVILTDTLPFDGAEFVSTSMPTGFVQSGNQLIWNLGELPQGYYGYYNNTIRVTLRVPASAPPGTIFTNTAEIGMTEPDVNTANNSASVPARAVSPTRDMGVTKTLCRLEFSGYYACDPGSLPSPGSFVEYVPGDTVQYAITFRNGGNSPATDVRITDTLPFAGATFVTATRSTSLTVVGSQLIWNLGQVLPQPYIYGFGETFYVQLKVPAATPPGTLFTNTVQVSLNETDILTSNNASLSVGQVVTPLVSLLIQKTVNAPKTLPGRTLAYNINVLHNSNYYQGYSILSNTDAKNVRVTDTLPAGVTLLGLSYPQSATVTNNQIVWSLGTLMRGATQNLTVSVQTQNVPLGSVLTNTVQVGADVQEVHPEDNEVSVGVLVYTPTVTLVINKAANTNNALPGEQVTYTLNAYQTNYANSASEGDALNVVVTDVLPAGLTYLGSSAPASVTLAGNQLTWNVGTLAKADPYCYYACQQAELKIYARVNEAPLGTRITNTAYITSSEIAADINTLSSTHSLLVGEADIYLRLLPWERIAWETGGHAPQFFNFTVFGRMFDFTAALSMLFWDMQSTADIHQQKGHTYDYGYCSYPYPNCAGPITHTVHVDSSATQLQILLTHSDNSSSAKIAQITAPNGSVVLSGTQSSGIISMTSEGDNLYVINAPASGLWRIVIIGNSTYRLTTSAIAAPFALISKPALPPGLPGVLKAHGSPSSGATFSLLDDSGTPTATASLLDDGAHNDGAANDGTFGGTWIPIKLGSYQLVMSGTAALQHAPEASLLQRIDARPIHVQNLIVTGPGSLVAQPGSSGTVVFTLTNHNATTRTVGLTYSQSHNWASFAGAPSQLRIGPGQSQPLSIGYSVPATATDFSAAQINVLAQSSYVAEFGDYETAQLTAHIYADVALSAALPAAVKPGQNVTLTIAYSNTGGVTANGLRLTAVLPPGLSYLSDSSGVTPIITGNQLAWPLPALPANGSGGFVLIASAAANATGNLNIALSISTTSDEINMPNNSAAPVTQVTPPDNSKRKIFLPVIRR